MSVDKVLSVELLGTHNCVNEVLSIGVHSCNLNGSLYKDTDVRA
jgi:hypothetical protein